MAKIDYKIILMIVLAVVVVWLDWLYIGERRSLTELRQEVFNTNEAKSKKTEFLKLFVEKVINGKGEVVFEDRLKLENMIRDIGDDSILQIWKKFVDSEKDDDLQKHLKELLSVFVNDL